MRTMSKPLLLCLLGKSGCGKSTIADRLYRRFGYVQAKSYTTRPIREECDGDELTHTFITREQIADQSPDSHSQIQRYIRLTYLLPDLIDMVDAGKLGFNAAVELSYLDDQQQFDFLDAMEYSQNVPSLSQAQRIKKMCQSGECDEKVMQTMLSEDKKQPEDKVTFKGDFLRKYFPKNYTPQQMEDVIVKLLKQWQKKRQREQEL